MMKKAAVLLACVLFLCVSPAFAQNQGKVLLYYFQNLTGDDAYDDLMFGIPLCLYGMAGEEDRYLIVERGLARESTEENLWDPDWLQSVATKKRITRVLFGYFYLDQEELVLRSRMYFLESGLILDVSPGDILYDKVREVEGMTVAQARSCAGVHEQAIETGKKKSDVLKVQRTPPEEIARSSALNTMSWCTGLVLTTADWLELYPLGISALVSYVIYPRREVSRLALGLQSGFYLFSREKDQEYDESSLMVIPFGGYVQYALVTKGSRDLLVVHGILGMSYSSLGLGNSSTSSLDLYSKAGVGMNLLFLKEFNLYLGVGLASVSYKDVPLNMVTAEAGIRFFE